MKYNFEMRSVAREQQPITEKHDLFLRALGGLPEPWAVREMVGAPDPGAGLSASLKVTKILGKGLRGDLTYQFRRPFRDEASSDDWLNISFNPLKINYRELIDSVFMNYVFAFDAYYAEIADDEFIFRDYEERRRLKGDKRHSIYRLAPVSYISNELCLRAFGVDAEAAAKRLTGHVEHVRVDRSGLFVVLTYEPLPADEMDRYCREAKERLVV